MNRLSAWFSPTFLDLFWFALFGHFIGHTKEETRQYFISQRREESLDNFNDILHTDGSEFD
jgi:hypothetical protein